MLTGFSRNLTINKTWMKFGDVGKPYLFKCLTSMLQKDKGNVPWFNRTVKNKLIQRDHFKCKAIKTDDESDWKLYKSFGKAANIALRNAEREYYATKFLNNRSNPNMRGKQQMKS